MEYTTNYNLKKPEAADQADIGDINDNMDTIDTTLNGLKTKQTAVGSPAASGTASAFIDSITQDANGVITATKKNITNISVSNKGATLAWNTTSTIATVAGTNITAKLPANPNTDTNTWRLYTTKTFSISGVGLVGNGYGSFTANDFNVSPPPGGYEAVALVRADSGNKSVFIYNVNAAATGTGVMMRLKNTSSSEQDVSPTIVVLYFKTGQP